MSLFGGLNLNFFWVNFKVWGVLPLTIIFTGLQLPLIKKFNDETKINN